MLKKYLSILLVLVMLVSSVMGFSMVNASATTDSDSRIKLQELLTEYNSNFAFDYPSYYYYIYTKASFNAFLDAKQKAENLLADENTTDEEFENMIIELQTARNNLVEIVRSESYERLLSLSADYSWDFDYTPEYWYSFYTRESYDAYLAAKQKAEKLLAEEYPSDEELEAMIEEFKTAHDNLVRVDKSESYRDLAYLYSIYSWDFKQPPEYWYNIYTKKSYDAYLAAKQKAEKLLADENATDEELDAMIEEFKTARDNLLKIEDAGWTDITKDELENLVNDTYDIMQPGDLYRNTDAFFFACNFAREILEKENPTQEELNNAYYNLVSAIENLERVGWVASPFLLGDCNQDGKITIKDATKIQMTLAKFDDISYYVMADVDRDFSVDIKDATRIQLYCAEFLGEENCAYTGEYDFNYYYNKFYTI